MRCYTCFKLKLLTLGWIPRNFNIFIFEPKLSFLRENHKNDKWGEFPDFFELINIYDFGDFQGMAIFVEHFKIIYVGWIRKNPSIHPSYYFLWFSLENDNSGLNMNILKFLEILNQKIGLNWTKCKISTFQGWKIIFDYLENVKFEL